MDDARKRIELWIIYRLPRFLWTFLIGAFALWILTAILSFILLPLGLGNLIVILTILPTAWLLGDKLTGWVYK